MTSSGFAPLPPVFLTTLWAGFLRGFSSLLEVGGFFLLWASSSILLEALSVLTIVSLFCGLSSISSVLDWVRFCLWEEDSEL